MWRLRGVCAVLLLCFVPSRQVELCAQEYVDTGAKVGFQLVQYALNTGEWEKLAEENSLDPYAPDEKLDVNVPCAYFGSALCTAQASSCKKSKIQLRLKAITGLKSVHIDNLEVSEVRSPLSSRFSTLEAHRSASACWANAVDPTEGVCSYSSRGNQNGDAIDCGLAGRGSGHVSIPEGAKIEVDIEDVEVKVQCHNSLVGSSWWEKPFTSKTVTCSFGEGSGAFTSIEFCGGTCNKSLLSTSYTHVKLVDFRFENYEDTIQCEASGLPSGLSDSLMKAIEVAVINMINKPIQDVLNGVLKDEVGEGLPEKCEAPSEDQLGGGVHGS
eukprot:scaffold8044_cov277-Pinguiococcus_pyrenoidosus.AAC.2